MEEERKRRQEAAIAAEEKKKEDEIMVEEEKPKVIMSNLGMLYLSSSINILFTSINHANYCSHIIISFIFYESIVYLETGHHN